jgi:hypothetical protein
MLRENLVRRERVLIIREEMMKKIMMMAVMLPMLCAAGLAEQKVKETAGNATFQLKAEGDINRFVAGLNPGTQLSSGKDCYCVQYKIVKEKTCTHWNQFGKCVNWETVEREICVKEHCHEKG